MQNNTHGQLSLHSMQFFFRAIFRIPSSLWFLYSIYVICVWTLHKATRFRKKKVCTWRFPRSPTAWKGIKVIFEFLNRKKPFSHLWKLTGVRMIWFPEEHPDRKEKSWFLFYFKVFLEISRFVPSMRDIKAFLFSLSVPFLF